MRDTIHKDRAPERHAPSLLSLELGFNLPSKGGSHRPHCRKSGSLVWLLYTILATVYDSQMRRIQATRRDRDERLDTNQSGIVYW